MHGYTKQVQRQVHFVAVELAFCQLLERSIGFTLIGIGRTDSKSDTSRTQR